IALMRREKPDIIHTHTAKAGTLGRAAALLALPGRRKRLYHTFHGHVFSGYFGPRKTRMFLRIERFLGRYTDRLIAVSERTRDDLIAYRIAPAEKIAVVPLGLELDPFLEGARFRGELRRELCLPPDALLIGLVARLVPIKAIPDFLEAAAIVAERVPNAVFVIVGDGEMRQELEAQARALGLGARARFLGFRKDLPRLYADLDMVVLSSRNEGLPTSLIEAMASGCVVVSTAVGGVPDLIQEGETGYLAPPAEPGALAAAIQRALAERERWPQITQCAQESARERFHLQRLMAEIEALYEN
ncbi:MAG TPA: glycosyltransferase, partial [Chthonomonadaceae bacterium]|nr:glycosyltransferase [Chthonomonadaceae bacterium]